MEKRVGVHLIRYCDDFVALSSRPFGKTIPFIEAMLNNLELELSPEKTRITTDEEDLIFSDSGSSGSVCIRTERSEHT